MKKGLLVFFVLVVFFLYLKPIFADDNSRQQELQRQIEEYSAKLTDIRKQKNTLSSQIQYMDTQIYLTQLKIQETEQNIERTQKEIDVLGERIDGLDTSMNYYTKLLLSKVVENYKNKSISFYSAVLDSDTVNDFFNRFKYIKITQQNNQKLLIQVQQTKLNFEEQKKIREQKKIDLDNLMITLDKQKVDLKNQQNAKKSLLAVTNNSETTYQALLDKARRELEGYSSYTLSRGGGLTSFGKGTNGWYYTQRDPAWGNMNIGNSSYPVWQAGCALTSLAMVCTSYGSNITPGSIASDPSNFVNGDLIDSKDTCPGKDTKFIDYPSREEIKNKVSGGPVILRLYAPSVSGLHFIVVWKWDEGANDFIMHDPYNGPDMKFSSLYSWSQVTKAALIR